MLIKCSLMRRMNFSTLKTLPSRPGEERFQAGSTIFDHSLYPLYRPLRIRSTREINIALRQQRSFFRRGNTTESAVRSSINNKTTINHYALFHVTWAPPRSYLPVLLPFPSVIQTHSAVRPLAVQVHSPVQ